MRNRRVAKRLGNTISQPIDVGVTTDESRTPARRKKIEQRIVRLGVVTFISPKTEWKRLSWLTCSVASFAKTGLIDAKRITHRRRQPYDHRHMDLRFWRNRVRHAVKIHEVFAEAFAMIGYVKHSGINAVTGRAGKHADEPRQNMVRIDERIIVGVDDVKEFCND